MTDNTNEWSEEFWYRGKVTRRRLIGYGTAAGALGATMLVPAPWQAAFGQATFPPATDLTSTSTRDLSDGQDYNGVRVDNPFRS